MAAPLSMPSDPTRVWSVWRAISSLSFVRRLLGIPEEESALASAARGLDTSFTGPDTSLTQAELEVLK